MAQVKYFKDIIKPAANDSNAPDVYVVEKTVHTLTSDITDRLLQEMRDRNRALVGCGLEPNEIISANVRAFGQLFLATLTTLTARERQALIEEFDLLTIQFLK